MNALTNALRLTRSALATIGEPRERVGDERIEAVRAAVLTAAITRAREVLNG